jgi:hypothetical protein
MCVTFADVLEPAFWAGHKLNLHDVIRVREADGAFDCDVTVTGMMQGGVIVEPMGVPAAEQMAVVEATEAMRPAVIV